MVVGLTTGLKVSSKSMSGCYLKPRATQQAFYLSSEPSERNLCLKSQLPETALVEGEGRGLGTSSLV